MSRTLVAQALVVDACPFFREGIRNSLKQEEHLVLAEVCHLAEIQPAVDDFAPNLILIGPNQSDHDAFALCREAASRWSTIKPLIINAHAHDQLFQMGAAAVGVVACLPLDISPEKLLLAIEDILNGTLLYSRNTASEVKGRRVDTQRTRSLTTDGSRQNLQRDCINTHGILTDHS